MRSSNCFESFHASILLFIISKVIYKSPSLYPNHWKDKKIFIDLLSRHKNSPVVLSGLDGGVFCPFGVHSILKYLSIIILVEE